MDDKTKVKTIYLCELLFFAVTFLVIGILILVNVIKMNQTKKDIFVWLTLFGGFFILGDFLWAAISKKRREKVAFIDKILILPVALFLICFDIYALAVGGNKDNLPKLLDLTRIVIGINFIYLTVIYVFEGAYHWYKPVPGLLDIPEDGEKHIEVKIFDDDASLGTFLAGKIKELVDNKPNAVLGLATGSSPLSTYEALINLYNNDEINFSEVTTFNLDEYVNCSIKEQTYREFMEANLFKGINLKQINTHFPPEDRPEVYDDLISAMGGIDLQILGIGVNGHIAFNEPGTSFTSLTRKTSLTESTREANKRFFNDDINLVPSEAVTMGLGTIMKSKEIYLIANTANKKDAVEKLINEKTSLDLPASILRNHPKITILLTKVVDVKLN